MRMRLAWFPGLLPVCGAIFLGSLLAGCSGLPEAPDSPAEAEEGALDEKLDTLVWPMVEETARLSDSRRVCLQGFYDSGTGRKIRLSDHVTRRVLRALVAQGASVVERDDLDRVLAEQFRQGSDVFDPAAQEGIGQLAGADLLLLCPVTRPDAKTFRVGWKLTEIRSGDIVAAGEFDLDRRELPIRMGGV